MSEYNKILPTCFKEIWTKEDIDNNSEIIAWVVNPGQNFVVDDEILTRFPSLSILVTPSTGRNHINIEHCSKKGIKVFSLLDDRLGMQTITASAEFTFLLILNTLKRLDVGLAEVSSRRWRKKEDYLRGHELNGKKVGVVGFGRIGKHIFKWCEAFNAKVKYFDPYVNTSKERYESLSDLFYDSDIISINCILSDETFCMIDYALLKKMKKNACLINTSRGEVINQDDLVRILQERNDIRVGLDVLSGETDGTHLDSKLIKFHDEGRIVITPHIAGVTFESQLKAARIALELLKNSLK